MVGESIFGKHKHKCDMWTSTGAPSSECIRSKLNSSVVGSPATFSRSTTFN
ncbi:hypothetical protein CpipJ_CPIJ011747 [Culex quinquefasciatus]|uniref:Uncharacterized protein n=1 Tax=Culex quinquefasciatus TaxID=7176 RepID=B0WX25_CULQU|nr:hypothetical protein CpipJ_CPIJ011747 [Culex quinquefasciatus]|eukprot:XP_001861947.1 hypothetical protein CpipJ_CPIJ011747 [Culex quinquefasciatus]